LQYAHTLTNRPRAFKRGAWCCMLLLMCLLPVTSFAQQYNFDYINIKNGLVNNTVRSIYQDKKGIMYFGTNSGISIYYGNAFKSIDEVNGKKIGIINQIVGNPKDSVYIIASTIPFFYQLQGQQLTKHPAKVPAYIYSMLYDEGRFLACVDDGLHLFENGQFKKINLHTRDTIKFISKIISCNQNLWLIGRLGASMELVNKKSLQTTAISPRLTVHGFYKDAGQNIWIATKDKGVLYLSAADLANNRLQLSPVPAALDFLANAEISDITGDAAGNIYFATVGKGLVKMLPDQQVEIINTRNGLSSMHVRTAFVDREGNLWVGTNMGIDKLSVNRLNIYNDRFGLQSNICYDAALYKNRFLITPNNLGFSVIDDKNKSIINYPLPVQNESYPFRTCIADNRIYVLNRNSVAVVDDAFSGKTPYTNIISFTARINVLAADNKKNMLVGGISGIWLVRNNKPQLIISEPDVRTIMIDERDVLWIGRYDNGIACYQLSYGTGIISARKLTEWKTGYTQDHSRVLLRGDNSTVWYGTRFSGLYQLQMKDSIKVLKHVDAQTGLSSDFVQSLCLLPNSKLLVGTADGLDMIDVPAFYAVSTAVHKKFNFSSKINQIKLSEDGRLWMATDDGILNLTVDQLESKQNPQAELLITAVKVKGIENSTSLPGENSFDYNQNTVTFSFASPTYINENNMLYTWMLEGTGDNAWSEPAHTNTAGFADLNPGKYTFYAKMNDGANGNTISTVQYNFVIRKPFWKQYWFVAMLVVVAGFLLYRLLKLREKNIAEREAQKTELQKLKADNYQYQLEIEQVVSYFASSINQKNSIDELLWDVARNCIARLGFEDCVIYLVDERRKVLVQKAAWGHKTNAENQIVNPIDIPVGRGIVGAVAKSGKAEIVADTGKDHRYLIDDDIRLSEIAVPIIDNGKVIGVIDSEHPQKNFYTERHLQILVTIASLCADKIDKIKAEELTREKEIEVLKLQKDLATSQLTTLRAQMNPHFIFNALNSIQQFILQGNVEEANRYLSRFSKLQRQILNNSTQQFITLEKEIEILTLYLQLEELRFGHTFTYQLTTGSNIETAEIRIPTMIIQPFIENAIWHGLMAKTGDKKLTIDFVLSEDDFLICTIKDNGIGRQASALLKEVRPGEEKHQSKGLSLVYDRLGMLQQQYKQQFQAEVSDIDEGGKVAGTQVVLTMYTGD
jgi:two-component system, LytTR family, sensor kinase